MCGSYSIIVISLIDIKYIQPKAPSVRGHLLYLSIQQRENHTFSIKKGMYSVFNYLSRLGSGIPGGVLVLTLSSYEAVPAPMGGVSAKQWRIHLLLSPLISFYLGHSSVSSPTS